jgi:tRNA threonylcarbamoyladenosine biosynthesis protein TsaB
MRLLAIDTATEACSVALSTGTEVIGLFKEVGRGHAEQILAMVDEVLGRGGLALNRLDAIVANVGPGAFTGVRISVSVAQGLAFGAGLPVVPVTTLEALAWQSIRRSGARRVLACLDARMGEVYWGCFEAQAGDELIEYGSSGVATADAVRLPFDAQEAYGIGRGFSAYPALEALPGIILPPGAELALPDARDMVQLAASRFARDGGIDPSQLAPRYLRDRVALTEHERAAGAKLGS